MSSNKGLMIGMRSGRKSGGRKSGGRKSGGRKSGGQRDIRSRQKSNHHRGEKKSQHMMLEHQSAQSESNSMPHHTILIRMNDRSAVNEEIKQTKKLCHKIMNDFKDLDNYFNENLNKDYEMISWDEEDFFSNEEYNRMIDEAFENAERYADY